MTNRSLVLLSGEGTTIPAAEAMALFVAQDANSTFESPEPRVLVARSTADPFKVGRWIAFARRVGVCVDSPADALPWLEGRRVRFRSFDLRKGGTQPEPGAYLKGAQAIIDLAHPDYELTRVRGEGEYLCVTAPGSMSQAWSARRPRRRPFFHPSAIFPKLSRALVNLSRCGEGETFVEPFVGTGSIAMEAFMVGARVVGLDISSGMARGAWSNMTHFGQRWLGVIRADAAALPVRFADAVASDIPYGRASSTGGLMPSAIADAALRSLGSLLRPGSLAVIMHPQTLYIGGSREFRVEGEHHLHVHKLLTRTITVLEKR